MGLASALRRVLDSARSDGTDRQGRRRRRESADGAGRRGREGRDSSASTVTPTFEYAPDPDGNADPGEVVWAWVPYEDDVTQGKDRPVLIVGRTGRHLLGVPMSSKDHDRRRDADEWVDVGRGGWDSQGRPSEADAARVLSFSEGDIRREGATLGRDRFDEVMAVVRRLHPDLR